jgi:hypothetical protein
MSTGVVEEELGSATFVKGAPAIGGSPVVHAVLPDEGVGGELAGGEISLEFRFIDRAFLLIIRRVVPIAHGLGDREV